MQHWRRELEEINKAAQEAEMALPHTTDPRILEPLLRVFEERFLHGRPALVSANQQEAVASLEKRLVVLRRRINILRMSTEYAGEGYTDKKDETDDFYERNNSRVGNYIKIASNSIHSIDRQKNLLNRSRKKLEDGLLYLGVSDRVVDQISNRYLTDYRIFKGLLTLFILLFIYVFLIRKK